MIKRFLKSHPVHKKIVIYLDLFFLLRPTLFFAVWVMVVTGMISAQMFLNGNLDILWLNDISIQTFFIFIGLSLLVSSTFIINQIYDLKSDKINKKLFLLDDSISLETGKYFAKALLIAGSIIAIFANWLTGALSLMIYFLWGILYNKSPFNWKNKPIKGWLINAVVGSLLFLIGWLLVIQTQLTYNYFMVPFDFFYYLLPYVLCYSSVSLLTTLPDQEGVKACGVKTFPLVFGESLCLYISM